MSKRAACQNKEGRTAEILRKGGDNEWQKIIYDCGGSGSGIVGVKVKSLPDCAELNVELQKQGYLTVEGRVNATFFIKRSVTAIKRKGNGLNGCIQRQCYGNVGRIIYRFTNWKGERKYTQKREFATKR